MSATPTPASREIDLLLLHPAGSLDPQAISLSIGMLELLRLWFENAGLSVAAWPETAIDADGSRRFVLRAAPWQAGEVRRKLSLMPTAERVLMATAATEPAPQVEITIEDRRGDRLTQVVVPLDPALLFEQLPEAARSLATNLDHEIKAKTPAEFFQTSDPTTAVASIAALERLAAFKAGVGRDEPGRLLEPVLALLAREPGHAVGRECLARIAAALVDTKKPEGQAAACEALEKWCDLAPLSPAPAYFLAVARQQSGSPEPARAAYEEALRRDPFFVPAIQGYAEWLAERGFIDQGVGVLQRALGQTAHEGSLLDQAGCLLANAGRLAEAEPLFERSIASGGPPTAHTNLARSLLARGHEAEALETLRRGMDAGVEKTHLELLGKIARGTGIVSSQARAILRGRFAEEMVDEEIQRTLVSLCLEIDGPEAAAPYARRLIDGATKPESRRLGYYVLLRSRMEDFERRWDAAVLDVTENDAAAAEVFFREVITLEPEFGRARFLLAAAIEKREGLGPALAHVEIAAQTEGDDPGVLDLLARARAQAGDAAGAAQAHHRAATLAPQDPRILRNAAVSMIRAGYIDEGIGLARASLALQPGQPEMEELLREISAQRSRRGGVFGKILRSIGLGGGRSGGSRST
jgi:tetratricopeptide (TPR) repeat protein